MIDRTKEIGCGRLVEDLCCYAADKQLSDAEHDAIVEWTLQFEECFYSEDALRGMEDAELLRSAYWVMVEYARGQQ